MGAPQNSVDAATYRLKWVERCFNLGWSFVRLRGKRPVDKGWQDAPRSTLDECLAWAKDGNVGVRTGIASGVVVIDEDTLKGGRVDPVPETPTALTGGGGRHFYLLAPTRPFKNSAGKIAPHVDTKGDRGQVVFVGSVHPDTGEMYRWADGLSPDDVPFAPVPSSILDVFAPAAKGKAKTAQLVLTRATDDKSIALESACERVRRAPEGQRNNALNLAAFLLGVHVRTGQLVEQMVVSALLDAALEAQLAEGEAIATIRSGLHAGIDKAARSGAPGAESIRPTELCTDLGNVGRFVRLHGKDLRHGFAVGWLVWDGKRFRRDDTGAAMRRAKATARSILKEAVVRSDEPLGLLLAAWALDSQSSGRLNAMLSLAETELDLAVRGDDLDRDPFQLNCANGTIDLRTGTLLPHARENLITKLTSIEYSPEAKAPLWDKFLDEVMLGDHELIDFLQRVVGYALTGDVSEQVWFFLYGKGANGKSTFLRVILHLLGEYGMQAAPELLLAKRGEAHPTEVADLAGRRLAVCTEIEQGRALAEVQVKQMTGGDRMKARFMRQDFFEFEPTHKIFLGANHRPIIRGTDYAIWRRINLIPFNATFREDKQDKALLSKLLAELPGILTWAVRGCLEWQNGGLRPPKAVVAATDSYREDQDVFADFLAERCVLGPERYCSADALYQAFVAWCQATGEMVFPQKVFGGLLSDRGFDRAKHGTSRRWHWFGIDVMNPLNPSNPSSELISGPRSHASSSATGGGEGAVAPSTGNHGFMGSMGSPPPACDGPEGPLAGPTGPIVEVEL